MNDLIISRRSATSERIEQLRRILKDAEQLVGDVACVYMTGSFGRGEASSHSDLDLFIASDGKTDNDGLPLFGRLKEILVKASLIGATRQLKIPDFSDDGEYLQLYTTDHLLSKLGTSQDDASNTLTARLLLLLESRPLVGERFYESIITSVISAYWRDYESHPGNFVPAFLANDILRLWRTFCVNYEAKTSTEPARKKAKRKIKNYKLKHSRLLTCYSGLLYLLTVFSEKKTVDRDNAREMVKLAPTERLQWLLHRAVCLSSKPQIEKLLNKYEDFLQRTDFSEDELIDRVLRDSKVLPSNDANELGDLVLQIIQNIGQANTFHRMLVV